MTESIGDNENQNGTPKLPFNVPLSIDEMMWGTYGKSGNEPLRWVRLVDCSTEHLEAILSTQGQITHAYRAAINSILYQRYMMRGDAHDFGPRKHRFEHGT